ncbi:hypothetical protein OMAG_002277 [Candidatus Omnitrophus magneticus]|uniref:Uncharacterized protein n=1 Tax=Candidatus Omnitrophus magneticus TaxID=1609969 RepID=A0A0F0CQR3_9BACT|nr:hypothetical protein OMAG_002277 [Candidatus Omnitrophus magneticus]
MTKELNLPLNMFNETGIYILLNDESWLALTRENIEKITQDYWNNVHKFSDKIKEMIEFQRCQLCPAKGGKDFCDALRPILPLLEIIDEYNSFDKISAVYKSNTDKIYYVSNTTIQEALQYIAILSLTQYCQLGKKYWKYYLGTVPLMNGQEVSKRIYLNIYWLCKGDKEVIQKIIKEFSETMRIIARTQVRRLNLICKNDAFMNAFINAHVITEMLDLNIENILEKAFEKFENNQ